ncbi:UPF0182 family protein [Iocasia frigidifontis]|uniref:UPF0182 protein GM661_09780 n=1 Tax=Iocasia fonsfrigidae TaxID=2682810 RepID=A0A8A7KEZ0_9FIRM|nr:UPF0182 family protein [Iocasia fonsfrigidae]QTL98248.1 UPF0182 family protein [Iocasia fonsfrigidae]
MSKTFKVLLTIIILALFALMILIFSGSQFYTEWLWFKNLNYQRTFITMFFTNFWLRIIVGLLFTIFLYINLSFTKKPLLEYLSVKGDDNVESLFRGSNNDFIAWLNKKRLNYLFLLSSIILGFLFSSINQELWKIVLKYFNQTEFGIVDPIFSQDISFYVFSLPFYNFLKDMGMVLTVLTLITIAIIYTLSAGINSFKDVKFKLSSRAKTHITVLITLFLFLKALSYRLRMYDLLYSARGVVFGAGYTDVNANMLGLRVLTIIAFLTAIILLINLFKKNYRVLLWSLGLWLIASIIFGSLYPSFIQRFQVEPNEIDRERKYISYNIDMTLKAYGLNDIKEEEFRLNDNLTNEILADNEETVNNIRLLDPRPLLSTYNQLQGLRQYYTFPNIDIDRYMVDGEYRQVMLAARELDQNRLASQARTWINQKLKYTHGYGVTMSPVNTVTSDGLPTFLIKDIPPKTFSDIEVDNPAIYYGEKTNSDYIIANTKEGEFDYPLGSENAYTDYDGTGGVQLNNYFKKVLYAIRYSNIKLLLNQDITPESRIMYYRNIKTRVRKTAPFLSYDADPYLVVSEGRLFWIQDAYTTTDRFPYSQTSRIGNYIRNSIKVVIDTYNGSMKFYLIDEDDPLAVTYQKIFPDLFVSGEQMPDDIRAHLRYPQDLFLIQTELYSTYHMKNPTVFYNKEDRWNIPTEKYAGNSIQMQPYYNIVKLPDNENSEFVLMLPFTPINKNNMVAWIAARSDGDKYGELLVYSFPKDKLVYGPMQVESRIDQNADISQLLSLWGQRGSRVIRGNLLVIPIGEAILYVEPVYLQAETSELPELKRVVVAYKDRVVMRETFRQALNVIFGVEEIEEETEEIEGQRPGMVEIISSDIQELSSRALEVYQEAQQSLKEGNWADYGEQIERLSELLERLNEISNMPDENM